MAKPANAPGGDKPEKGAKKYTVLGSIYEGGRRYKRGNIISLSEKRAAALGDVITKGEVKLKDDKAMRAKQASNKDVEDDDEDDDE